MLRVLRVHLPSDIPIVGCELTPYVLLRRPDNTVSTDDVPEFAPVDGCFLRYRWYRIQGDKRIAVCNVHPSELGTLQCLGCVKAKLPIAKSYHCSTECFLGSWHHHRALHARAASTVHENGAEDDEMFGKFDGTGSAIFGTAGSVGPTSNTGDSSAGLSNGYASGLEKGGVKTWYVVGYSKTYTPTAEDVGHVLKLECVGVDAITGLAVAPVSTLLTACVIPAPSPTPRCIIPVNVADSVSRLELGRHTVGSRKFTVLSYNVLADLYATSDTYSYCPPWALSWSYRRQNLLNEIVGYHADILCLQEVQSDHFEEFFAPELEKHGYSAVFKKKTTEVYTGTSYAIDGCATFFRCDRFSLLKKYEVEFNKAAQCLTDAAVPSDLKKAVLSRLLKDNVALIVVLETKDASQGGGPEPGKRQLLCVANTHIHSNPDFKDVKLWQVQTLLKGLEKIAASADIPMLVCGDFNSIPGSAAHALLATGKVEPSHPELKADPLGILRPVSRLCHQLPLVSAYSAFAKMVGGEPGLEHQRRQMDPVTNEPLFTNCTREFLGTLDYIFHTADSLTVESVLELLDEGRVRKDTALPSPEWSSDHIALLAEFRYKPRPQQ